VKPLWTSLIISALVLGVFSLVVPGVVEKRMNKVLHGPPYRASTRALELHRRLFIADLHADSLLWDRDLLVRGDRGHVDLPRLGEGNVALETFSIVTKVPRGLNIERNDDKTDNVFWLALSERWPAKTWRSLLERALYQANKLRGYADRSRGGLVVLKAASELDELTADRKSNARVVAGVLSVEGAHALDGHLGNLDVLCEAGVRMMAPTHFFDNEIGGSSSGVSKGGLTPLGRDWVRRMESKRLLIDLAHASPRTIDDVLSISTRPLIVSHTGVRAVCDNSRNLTSEHVKAIARTGGVIGIGYWPYATCGEDLRAIVRSIRAAVDLAGVDHVGLGSDFDGATTVPFDTTGLVEITDGLLAAGFDEKEVSKIMGGNVLRLFREALPESGRRER